jgi:hypothetical protein
MSNIYNYDLFISCAYEDKDSAQLLSRKLRELDFLAWFDVPEIEEGEIFIEKIREAMENSAVCVFLIGAGGQSPWAHDSVWSAIHSRLERTRGAFRIITVSLPDAHVDSSGTLMGLAKTQLISYQQQWAIVRFKESLNDEDALHELVLRIRGVEPNDQSDWLEGSFRKSVRLRAQNALNVDWHKLVLDLYSTSFDTFEQEDEVILQPDKVSCKLYRKSQILLEPDPQGDSRLPTSTQSKYGVGENSRRRFHTLDVSSAVYASISNHGFKIVAGMLMLLVSVVGYSWKSYFATKNSKEGIFIGSGISVEATQNVNSAQSNSAAAHTYSKVDRKTQSQKTSTTRASNQPPTQSSRKIDDVARKIIPNTPDLVATSSTRSMLLAQMVRAKVTKISEPEESFGHAEIPNKWEIQYKSKLAEIKQIYVEGLDNTDLDKDLQSRVLVKFIKALEKKGIEVLTKKEDKYRANGIAKLQFGPKEIKSGSVSVDLRDNKDHNINTWVASTECKIPSKKALHTVLCEASQQLGDKMVAAIQEAHSNVDKQEPSSSDNSLSVFPHS